VTVRIITGRFQPFHNGHLTYAIEAADGADLLVVGLTRAFDHPPQVDGIPDHRLSNADNPLSLAERAAVALSAVRAEPRIQCDAVVGLVPIEQPEWLRTFVPLTWEVVLTLHEEWNVRKLNILEAAGYQVRIACKGIDKDVHARDIRQLLKAGDARWRDHVPAGAAGAIDRLGLASRFLSV
jgi:nicotinamide-nucleotide adenylyltransferase